MTENKRVRVKRVAGMIISLFKREVAFLFVFSAKTLPSWDLLSFSTPFLQVQRTFTVGESPTVILYLRLSEKRGGNYTNPDRKSVV